MKIFQVVLVGAVFALGLARAGFAEEAGMMKQGMAMAPATDHGKYSEYTQADFDAAKDMKRVLFFAAKWCSTCMATHKAFQDKPDAVPAGVAVFKVDYDSSTDLKAKYGVPHMDTFVQVDKDGQKIALWNGGGVDGLAKNLK